MRKFSEKNNNKLYTDDYLVSLVVGEMRKRKICQMISRTQKWVVYLYESFYWVMYNEWLNYQIFERLYQSFKIIRIFIKNCVKFVLFLSWFRKSYCRLMLLYNIILSMHINMCIVRIKSLIIKKLEKILSFDRHLV